jgi:hypothetical protein
LKKRRAPTCTNLVELNDSEQRGIGVLRPEAIVLQVVEVLLHLVEPVGELGELAAVVVDGLEGVGDGVAAHQQPAAHLLEPGREPLVPQPHAARVLGRVLGQGALVQRLDLVEKDFDLVQLALGSLFRWDQI